MDIETVEIAVFLLIGAIVMSVEVFFRPRFLVAVAMWSAFLFVSSIGFYFSGPRHEPLLHVAWVSGLGSIALALIGVGSNWLGRKIRQNAIDRVTEFDRKSRGPGQFY